MVEAISKRPDENVRLKIEREGKTQEVTVHTMGIPGNNPLEKDKKVGRIGIGAGRQKAQIAVLPQSPAAMAGLQTGDEILKWDNEPVPSIDHLLAKLEARPSVSHQLEVKTETGTKTLLLPPIGPNEKIEEPKPETIIANLPDKRYAVTADEIEAATPTRQQTKTQAKKN